MQFPIGAFYFMYLHFICVLFYVQFILWAFYSMYNLFYGRTVYCSRFCVYSTCIASGDFPYISKEPVGSTLYKI